MKILHLIDSLGLGGAQTVVKGIFENQRKNKDIFLYVLRKREINIDVDHPNVKIFNSNKKYSLASIQELRNLIEKEQISIIHCHLFRSQVFGWILKRFYFPNIKLIFHEHGQIFQGDFYYNYFMKKSQGNVNLFIAVSKTTKKELIKIAHISSKKIFILYNFVDLDRFNKKKVKINIKEEKEKLGIKKGEFVVGFVGRLDKIKGCHYLIRALSHLKFNYKCLIIGDGIERKRLEDLSKQLNLDRKVILLGYKRNPEIFYHLMDVLVVPSEKESFGLSAIEAQASGIPVICSDIDALKEVVLGSPIFFENKSFLDLSSKLLVFKKSKEKYIYQVSEKNIQRFNIKHYLKNLSKIYNGSIQN